MRRECEGARRSEKGRGKREGGRKNEKREGELRRPEPRD